jgi:hypothetical protein
MQLVSKLSQPVRVAVLALAGKQIARVVDATVVAMVVPAVAVTKKI